MTDPTPKIGSGGQVWRPVGGLVAYYALLAAVYLLLVRTTPWLAERLTQVPPVVSEGFNTLVKGRVEPVTESAGEASLTTMLTMGSTLLLVLPVVWVYIFARQKRGFQQSLAQTLLILPIVVAVVVLLVKHTVALAFSLGGIVGAVAFRHRLEDTKDAVYIFITIAIGLAVGVQAYSVGFAASLFYNLVVIGMWMTDFARVPGQMTSEVAAKRVQLAKGMVTDKRTGEYVAQLDQQLLRSMTPEQLKALAEKALERKQEYQQSYLDLPEQAEAHVEAAVPSATAVPGLRATLEAVLERETKEWRFETDAPRAGGGVTLRYWVRCRKKVPPPKLLDLVRRAVASLTNEVSVQ